MASFFYDVATIIKQLILLNYIKYAILLKCKMSKYFHKFIRNCIKLMENLKKYKIKH